MKAILDTLPMFVKVFEPDYDSLCKSAVYAAKAGPTRFLTKDEARAAARSAPTVAQLKAGNYSKRKVSWLTPDLKLLKAEFTSTFRLVLFHSFGKLQNECRTTKKLDRGAFRVRTQTPLIPRMTQLALIPIHR